jgi:regulator of RNase E activity RraA
MCGPHTVTTEDFVLGDDDGILFIPLDRAAEVAEVAAAIRDTGRSQAAKMHLGASLRSQAHFDAYLAARSSGAEITFRQHLRAIGGEIEE